LLFKQICWLISKSDENHQLCSVFLLFVGIFFTLNMVKSFSPQNFAYFQAKTNQQFCWFCLFSSNKINGCVDFQTNCWLLSRFVDYWRDPLIFKQICCFINKSDANFVLFFCPKPLNHQRFHHFSLQNFAYFQAKTAFCWNLFHPKFGEIFFTTKLCLLSSKNKSTVLLILFIFKQ
jgi:hypothetical protein